MDTTGGLSELIAAAVGVVSIAAAAGVASDALLLERRQMLCCCSLAARADRELVPPAALPHLSTAGTARAARPVGAPSHNPARGRQNGPQARPCLIGLAGRGRRAPSAAGCETDWRLRARGRRRIVVLRGRVTRAASEPGSRSAERRAGDVMQPCDTVPTRDTVH